jgi:DNA-directed RNA polymerase subunit omega
MRPAPNRVPFFSCVWALGGYLVRSRLAKQIIVNADYARKALEKVGNPNVLVNLISRRVRQLNSGSGALSRPLLTETGNLGAGDIALLELLEGKMDFEMIQDTPETEPHPRRRKRS